MIHGRAFLSGPISVFFYSNGFFFGFEKHLSDSDVDITTAMLQIEK